MLRTFWVCSGKAKNKQVKGLWPVVSKRTFNAFASYASASLVRCAGAQRVQIAQELRARPTFDGGLVGGAHLLQLPSPTRKPAYVQTLESASNYTLDAFLRKASEC